MGFEGYAAFNSYLSHIGSRGFDLRKIIPGRGIVRSNHHNENSLDAPTVTYSLH